MGGEWREVTVGEFAPFNYGKGLPKRARNHSGQVPVTDRMVLLERTTRLLPMALPSS
jgi:hypothetical protein